MWYIPVTFPHLHHHDFLYVSMLLATFDRLCFSELFLISTYNYSRIKQYIITDCRTFQSCRPSSTAYKHFCALDKDLHDQNILQSFIVRWWNTLSELQLGQRRLVCKSSYITARSFYLLPDLLWDQPHLWPVSWGMGRRCHGVWLPTTRLDHIFLFTCMLHFIGTCGDPTRLPNGLLEYTNITEGSRVTFKCNPGYILSGDTFRVCQSNGQWSNEHPQCIIKLLATSLRLRVLIAVCVIVKH